MNGMEQTIRDNLDCVRERIARAAEGTGRDPSAVKLVAVSKTVEAERVRAAIDVGVTDLGENYVQEARTKIGEIGHAARWHFIGHLQTNKAKFVVDLFDTIQTVDRLKLAETLSARAAASERILDVLIQVNISGEETKSGAAGDEAVDLVRAVAALPNLAVRGLMTMPPFYDEPECARPYFISLRELRDRIDGLAIPGVSMEELSMGMSGDFEVAIEEGATIVRVGTAIFGARA